MTKFFVIASGKGGVGKTTTAINLASAINSFGHEVILVDANLSTPNIGIYLGSTKVPISIHDVLAGKKPITDAIYLHRHGIKVVPASLSIKEQESVQHNLLETYIRELAGKAEVVIIDSAAGLDGETVSAIRAGDEVIIITTPDLASVTDALKTVKLCEKNDKKIFGVIINKAKKDDFEMDKANIEYILEHPVIAMIPQDDLVRQSIHVKTPVTYSHPNSKSSVAFKKLAAKIIGEEYAESVEEKESVMDSIMKGIGIKP